MGLGWDLCVGLLYEHRFAVLINMYNVLDVSLISKDISSDQADVVRVVKDGQTQHGCRVLDVASEHLNEANLYLEGLLT